MRYLSAMDEIESRSLHVCHDSLKLLVRPPFQFAKTHNYLRLVTTIAYLGLSTVHSVRFGPTFDEKTQAHGIRCLENRVAREAEVVIDITNPEIDFETFQNDLMTALDEYRAYVLTFATKDELRGHVIANLSLLYPESIKEKIQRYLERSNGGENEWINVRTKLAETVTLKVGVKQFPYESLTSPMIQELRIACDEAAKDFHVSMYEELHNPLLWLEQCTQFLNEINFTRAMISEIDSAYSQLSQDKNLKEFLKDFPDFKMVLQHYYEQFKEMVHDHYYKVLQDAVELSPITNMLIKFEIAQPRFPLVEKQAYQIFSSKEMPHVEPIASALQTLAADKSLFLSKVDGEYIIKGENELNHTLASILKYQLPTNAANTVETEKRDGRNLIDIAFDIEGVSTHIECKIACKDGALRPGDIKKATDTQVPSYVMNNFGTYNGCLVFYVNGCGIAEYQSILREHFINQGYQYTRVQKKNSNWYKLCINPDLPEDNTFDVFSVVLNHKSNSQFHSGK